MKFLIIGSGAMGLYFAARLTQAGHDVTVLARPTSKEATAVRFTRGENTGTISPIPIVSSPPAGAPDCIILATKVWQAREALQRIEGRYDARTPILTLQNGIDAPIIARELFPDAPILAATCVVHVQRTAPGALTLLGADATLLVGLFDAIGDAAPIVAAIDESAIAASLAPDIHLALWKKLALIASYGGIGAVSGLPVGVTRDHPETRRLVREAITEAANVARASGVNFTDADEEETFAIYAESFAPDATSSMQRDLAAGRPSELAAQNGAIVSRAATLGVPVPIHSFIYRTQLPREREARHQGPGAQ